MKVVVFSHNLCYEGASISLKELVLGLTRRGDIDPAIVAFEDGPLRAEFESNGIPVQVFPGILHKVSTLNRLSIEVERLALLIQESGAGLVFVNTLLNFPAILAAERAGVPSVWNPRESEPWDSAFRFLPDPVAQFAIAAIGLPRKVVFVARATRKVWNIFDVDGGFEVIHNGINLNRFPLRNDATERTRCRSALGLKAGSIAVLCVGTLCDRKGQMDLVEAFAALPEAISSRVQILFVGDDRGSYAEAIKDRCRSLPVSVLGGIRIVPPTESIASFYAAADVYVLSSKVESFPRVVLEAMAFGLPIITTPVFGVLEQVVEGENALFYPPGNSRLLAEQIEQLVSDDALRLRMAESSLQRISQMTTFDEMVAAYASVCREAVS
ncbi:MAG: glycosyltransferase family 4 protein [Dechloromonas sp.]|uniref:glycosyltransferase family 4 protein n=1 Tax=Dechloromonas sp. TaxID=1917218 RepID=UPI0027FB174D|nr:glycosyltransferase family 4 protein [Dechloromonas sp.]MBT9519362.1 glycosyltransferase family 4 protein [Dechloromonas sp.]